MKKKFLGVRFLAVFLAVLVLAGSFGIASVQVHAFESARDDGTWLWPLPSSTLNGVTDWAGCRIGACVFHCELGSHGCDAPSHTRELGHAGMDIGGAGIVEGQTPVYASAAGTVVVEHRPTDSRGYTIVIEHEYKEGMSYYSYYQHLYNTTSLVHVGDTVVAGQHIGYVGNTGVGTGAHLHFGMVYGQSGTVHSVDHLTWYEDKESGWLLTNSLTAMGRILVNPAATNEVAIKDLGSGNLSRHKGSIHYTCDPSHVNIGMDGVMTNPENPWYYSSTPGRAMTQGMNGKDVVWLQQALNVIMGAGLGLDGSFGPSTHSAVIAFQAYYGLTADGSFGPVSLNRMAEELIDRGYMMDGSIHTHEFTDFTSNGDGTHLEKCGICEYYSIAKHSRVECSGDVYCDYCGYQLREPETAEDFVSRLYTVILDREADENSLAEWTDYLETGVMTGAEVAEGFIMSNEFLNKPMTNEEFVRILYSAFFGREAASNEVADWVAYLNLGYRKSFVFSGFANSNEFKALCESYGVDAGSVHVTVSEQQPGLSDKEYNTWLFVERMYTEVLTRTPDMGGIQGWVDLLKAGTWTGAQVAEGFILSEEFLTKEMTNEEYVKIMYMAFFGREADPDGLAGWVDALETGYTKEFVFVGFANSTEFGVLCNSFGITQGSVPMPEQ